MKPTSRPLSLLLAACCSMGTAAFGFQEAGAPKATEPQPYLRVVRPDANTVQLQVALRKFTPAGKSAPIVWLTGVSHIGDPAFYETMQKHLDEQKLVLFEGVGEGPRKKPSRKGKAAAPSESPAPTAESKGGDSLQSTLATSLGLVFQLEAIDYSREHFRNSDMSVTQLRKTMQGDGKGPDAPASPEFEALLKAMDGSSAFAMFLKAGFKWIGTSPQLQASFKLMLVETLGRLRGDIAQLRGLPPDMKRLVTVLIEARNQVVLDDLKAELGKAKPPASISIFYGAGHMDNMEKRLRGEMKMEPAGEVWLNAITVDLKQTGMSPAQLEWLRAMIDWQMKQMMQ